MEALGTVRHGDRRASRARLYSAIAALMAPPPGDQPPRDLIRELTDALAEVGMQPPADLTEPPADRLPLREA